MKNLRIYGNSSFQIALIHGGPGGSGEMAPVAKELSSAFGVLEPLQTADSIEGQVNELKSILENNGDLPIILVGFSWGAWLSYIFTARHPTFVKKLILISTPPLEDKYVSTMTSNRMNRLTEKEKKEVFSLKEKLNNPNFPQKNICFAKLGMLFSKADAYDSLPHSWKGISCQYHIYQNVWDEAKKLRKNSTLLQLGKQIQCPVVAIHGDYDSHPAEGVELPLSSILKKFEFILLKNCGHHPWLEKLAKDPFYKILKKELSTR